MLENQCKKAMDGNAKREHCVISVDSKCSQQQQQVHDVGCIDGDS